MTSPRPPVPNRLLIVTFTFVVPMTLAVAATFWVRSFAHQLPDPVATHWGPSGKADRTGSWQGTLTAITIMAAVLCALGTAIGIGLGRWAATRRLAVLISMWTGIALPWLIAGSLWHQRNLTNALEAPDVYRPMWVAFSIAGVLAAIAAALMPPDKPQPATAAIPPNASRLPLTPKDLATTTWEETVEMRAFPYLVGIGTTLTVFLTLLAVWRGLSMAAVGAATVALVTLLLVAMGRYTITINQTGLTARPTFGRPRTRIPLNEVLAAEATTIKPFAEFGGWGYRVNTTGTVGIVIRAGEALKVHRSGNRDIIISINNAAEGAALLNTLAEADRAGYT